VWEEFTDRCTERGLTSGALAGRGQRERKKRKLGRIPRSEGGQGIQLLGLTAASDFCHLTAESRQSAALGSEPSDMSETSQGGSKADYFQELPCVACLDMEGVPPCRLGQHELRWKVPNLPQGEIPHGTGRRSRARAGNREPRSIRRYRLLDNGKLGHVHVICGSPTKVALWEGSWQRRGPTGCEPARGCPSAAAAACGEQDGGQIGGPLGASCRIGRPKPRGGQ
jgi:hypothetical protein